MAGTTGAGAAGLAGGAAFPYLQAAELVGTVGMGAYQLIKAKQLQKKLGDRPVYDYTEAKAANQGQLALAQGEAPGLAQQMQGVNQSLANTTQSIANMAPSGAAGLGALVQAGAGTQQTVADLLANAAQQKLGLQQNYLQGKAGLQQYADQAFQINQLDPYVQKQNEIAAMKQAGLQNLGGALSAGVDMSAQNALAAQLKEGSTGIAESDLNAILEKAGLLTKSTTQTPPTPPTITNTSIGNTGIKYPSLQESISNMFAPKPPLKLY
jgi:hypothetical protein